MLVPFDVMEVMGLAGLCRGSISQKPQRVNVAVVARLGLTSQPGELCTSVSLLVVILPWQLWLS